MSDTTDDAPQSIQDVVDLYYTRYKPLYNLVQTFNEMPVELVFEVAAAWDHLSRQWRYDEPAASCAEKASRHIKRGILDAFKIILRRRMEDYGDLRRVDMSLIDNGDFDRDLRKLISEIRLEAVEARQLEGQSFTPGDWEKSFDAWDKVFAKLQRFHDEFYLNHHINWARRKTRWFSWRLRAEGIAIAIGASLIAAILYGCFSK